MYIADCNAASSDTSMFRDGLHVHLTAQNNPTLPHRKVPEISPLDSSIQQEADSENDLQEEAECNTNLVTDDGYTNN